MWATRSSSRLLIPPDPADNRTLRRRYGVTQEYDYIESSIYKCFLACDAVSDETLLSYHYRCSPKIIEFNNRKYYNHKLHIASRETDPTPLVYVDVPNDTTDEEKHRPQEVRRIEAYLRATGQAGGHHYAVCEEVRRLSRRCCARSTLRTPPAARCTPFRATRKTWSSSPWR